MKVILLQHLSGAKSYEVGEDIEVTDREALRFIQKGIAEAKSKKAHNDLMAKMEKIEQEEAEKNAKIVAIQKEKELKAEADAMLDEIDSLISLVETVNPEFRGDFLTHMNAKLGKGK